MRKKAKPSSRPFIAKRALGLLPIGPVLFCFLALGSWICTRLSSRSMPDPSSWGRMTERSSNGYRSENMGQQDLQGPAIDRIAQACDTNTALKIDNGRWVASRLPEGGIPLPSVVPQ